MNYKLKIIKTQNKVKYEPKLFAIIIHTYIVVFKSVFTLSLTQKKMMQFVLA